MSLLGGFFALANPFAATLAAEWLAGWAFVFSGVVTVFSAFGDKSAGERVMAVLVGILVALLGWFLLRNPLQGMVSLTVAAGCMLAVAGVMRVVWGFRARGNVRWALFFSGALSVLLSVMIFGNFFQAATTLLGVFLAVELISNGISLIVLSFSRKQAAA